MLFRLLVLLLAGVLMHQEKVEAANAAQQQPLKRTVGDDPAPAPGPGDVCPVQRPCYCPDNCPFTKPAVCTANPFYDCLAQICNKKCQCVLTANADGTSSYSFQCDNVDDTNLCASILAGCSSPCGTCTCPDGAPPSCPPGWTQYGLYCYQLATDPSGAGYSWAQGVKYCLDNGANAASVTSHEENVYIANQIAPSADNFFYWNGENFLRDPSGQLIGALFTDGKLVAGQFGDPLNPGVEPWLNNEPNNAGVGESCVHFYGNIQAGNPYGWNDLNCNTQAAFGPRKGGVVCKKSACACDCKPQK